MGSIFSSRPREKKKTEDIGASEDDVGNEDNIMKDDYEGDDMNPELMTRRPLYIDGEKLDYALTEEDPLKPMMTKEGKTNNIQ